jgi:1-acyl-sn-glycerol-3-phosphate acyltransferase
VLIFPEGTRSQDGSLQPFKPGGFHLALRSGCDIIPIAITGSREIVPKGSLRIRKGTIRVVVGKEISLKGQTKKNMGRVMEQVRNAMAGQLAASTHQRVG